MFGEEFHRSNVSSEAGIYDVAVSCHWGYGYFFPL